MHYLILIVLWFITGYAFGVSDAINEQKVFTPMFDFIKSELDQPIS